MGKAKRNMNTSETELMIPGVGSYIKNPDPFRHTFHAIIGNT